MLIMAYCIPELPQFIYPIIHEPTEYSRIFLAIFESYFFVVCWPVLAVTNILLCVTFTNLSNCVETLNETLDETLKEDVVMSTNQVYTVSLTYQSYQQIIDRLTTVFSLSLFFQEVWLILDIIFIFVGASKMEAIFFAIFLYGMSLEMSFLVVFQFYPMIVLNLNSKRFLELCKSLMVEAKYSKATSETFRELKIRPMGVHTITLNTLSDYVVFAVSLLLMLRKT